MESIGIICDRPITTTNVARIASAVWPSASVIDDGSVVTITVGEHRLHFSAGWTVLEDDGDDRVIAAIRNAKIKAPHGHAIEYRDPLLALELARAISHSYNIVVDDDHGNAAAGAELDLVDGTLFQES